MPTPIHATGQRDWTAGVDSAKTPTIVSTLNPNGLGLNQLAWLVNGTARDGALSPRDGYQRKGVIVSQNALPYLVGSTYQGDFDYVPATGTPYKIYVIGGHILKVDPDFILAPVDLSEVFGLSFVSTATKAYFAQGVNYLVIQSGNYNPTTKSGELPLIWDGASLKRSNGITGITVQGGNVPTEYPVTLPSWVAPTAGNSITFNNAVYPGNLYDKVVIATTAGAWICTAAITSIGANSFSIEVDTQNTGGTNAAGTYDFTVGYNGSNASMVEKTQTVTVQFNQSSSNITSITPTYLGNIVETGNQITITFANPFMYPGTIGDRILAYSTNSTIATEWTVTANNGGQLVLTCFTGGTVFAASGPLYFLLVYNAQNGQQVFNLPTFVGQNIAIPFPTATPDTYFGSSGDTVTVTNGAMNYGTYTVVGYGGILSWQAGTGIILQAQSTTTGALFPTTFTLTITATPSISGTNINQIPSAGPMCYYMGRIWYATGATANAGDIVGGPSGTLANNYLDSILAVTENPLVLGGDGFTMPSGSDNITGFGIPQMINASLGQGLLNIGTANAVFALQVPVTRADWIAADASNAPEIFVVQQSNGFVNDWSIVGVNGDLWFQSLTPDIRSLLTAVRYFQQWGNVDVSSNENRILDTVNRTLLGWASGIYFNNYLLMTTAPQQTPYGVVHTASIQLDFEPISTLEEQLPPAWYGQGQGLQIFKFGTATFNRVQRGFVTALATQNPGQIELWEIIPDSVGDSGKRITWEPYFPSFTWAEHELEMKLKKLVSGELWIDQIEGVVDIKVQYSPDNSGCLYDWYKFSVCSATDSTQLPEGPEYPVINFQPGIRRPIVFPEPPLANANETGRPSNIFYEVQPILNIKGQCRVRGFFLKAEEVQRSLYEGLSTQ